ncbi:MAG: helix-turn-helix domain-containing protein [Acidimicrobiia bacterium]|nr:helix-turn-helix domain-containing protein [Acidimicrobiia bacterium]
MGPCEGGAAPMTRDIEDHPAAKAISDPAAINHALLTVSEVAELTRRTPSSIYSERYRCEGLGALGVRIGRKILFRRGDIDAYIAERIRAEQRARAAELGR